MSGVTDALLGIAAAAGGGRLEDALTRVDQLRERHVAAARTLAPTQATGVLGQQIDAQFDDLTALVRALAVLREVSPRTLDVVAAAGELLSSRIVAACAE
jgi:aspartate kinase